MSIPYRFSANCTTRAMGLLAVLCIFRSVLLLTAHRTVAEQTIRTCTRPRLAGCSFSRVAAKSDLTCAGFCVCASWCRSYALLQSDWGARGLGFIFCTAPASLREAARLCASLHICTEKSGGCAYNECACSIATLQFAINPDSQCARATFFGSVLESRSSSESRGLWISCLRGAAAVGGRSFADSGSRCQGVLFWRLQRGSHTPASLYVVVLFPERLLGRAGARCFGIVTASLDA